MPEMTHKRTVVVSRRRALLAGAAALATAGCATSKAAAPKTGIEKPNLNVAAVTAVTNTGLYLAQLHGFFAGEGLHVKITPIVSSTTAISGQLHGEFDVTAGAYVSYILAEAKNPGAVSWRILTEGSVSRQGSQAVLVTSGSPIRTVADLRGKTIAANIVGNVGTLLIQAMLQAHSVPLSSVKLVAIPFPAMAAALKSGAVDAGWFDEPFLTMARAGGARLLYDTSQGATASFPISGYTATRAWAGKYPHAAAAFVRAIVRGQSLADTNPSAARQAVTTTLKVPASTASQLTFDHYPTTLDPAHIQRLADVMKQFGLLKASFNASAMTR
jgi:NitT/TauT family transport system substrate-binding protein